MFLGRDEAAMLTTDYTDYTDGRNFDRGNPHVIRGVGIFPELNDCQGLEWTVEVDFAGFWVEDGRNCLFGGLIWFDWV